MERPLLVTLSIAVKTYDIDFANIVHNMVHIRWLEDLRLQLLADHYPMQTMLADMVSPILTRTEIDYRLPIGFGDEVTGQMWISSLSRIRWTVQAEFIVRAQIHAAAQQFGYFANLETLRPVRIPTPLRQKWETAVPPE